MAFFAEVKQGVGIVSFMTFMVGFVPFIIFLASFINKKSYWKITNLDLVCGALSIAGLIFWYLTRVGNIAIFFSILADGLAAVPTIVKSFYLPETESYFAYMFVTIGSGITLLTIKYWTFQNWGYPAYAFLVDLVLFVLIKFKLGKR